MNDLSKVVNKMKGIVEAVRIESVQPSPSHQNLARLLAMFIDEVVVVIEGEDEEAASAPPESNIEIK